MSLIVAGGAIIGDPGTYAPWDPSLSQNPDAALQDNRGCAPGWATIYVQDSMTGGLVKVCRRLDAAILGPGGAAIIREETGPAFVDQSIINVADASRQVVETVGGALPSWTQTALILGAIAAIIFFWKK